MANLPLDASWIVTPTEVTASDASVTFVEAVDTPFNDITGLPAAFPPSAHHATHTSVGSDPITISVSQVTGFPSGLGTAATLNVGSGSSGLIVVVGNDPRLANARTPTAHAPTHVHGGLDAVTITYTDIIGIPTSFAPSAHAITHAHGGTDAVSITYSDLVGIPTRFTPSGHAATHKISGVDAIPLDTLATPTDNTNLNVSTTNHGLFPKLPNTGTQYWRDDGVWVAPSSSILLPSERLFDYDEFDGYFSTGLGVAYGKLGWRCAALGSPQVLTSNFGHDATNKANGVLDISVALSAGFGESYILTLGDIAPAGTVIGALGILAMEWRIAIDAIPVGGDDIVVALGLGTGFVASSTAFAALSNSICLVYWPGNSITNWLLQCSASSARSTSDTSIAVTAGNFFKLQLLTNSTWTSVQAVINGTPAGSPITTHIPTTTPLFPFIQFIKVGGSTRTHLYTDYYFKDYQFTR